MLKMTYGQVSNSSFLEAFRKIASTPAPTRVSYAVKKIGDALNKQRLVIEKEYLELTEPLKDKPEELAKAVEEFGKKEFEVDRNKLSLADLDAFKLSAVELTTLEPLYEEGPLAPVLPMKN